MDPIKAIFPSVKRINWLNILNTCEEGWWIVQITVLPLEAIIFISVTISWAEDASKPVVGSSQNKRAGSVNSYKNGNLHSGFCYKIRFTSVAKARRFFSPPDNTLFPSISPIRVLQQSDKRSFRNILLIFKVRSSFVIFLSNFKCA